MTPYKYRLCKNNKLNNNKNDKSLLILDNYNILDRDTINEINYENDSMNRGKQWTSSAIKQKVIKHKYKPYTECLLL